MVIENKNALYMQGVVKVLAGIVPQLFGNTFRKNVKNKSCRIGYLMVTLDFILTLKYRCMSTYKFQMEPLLLTPGMERAENFMFRYDFK